MHHISPHLIFYIGFYSCSSKSGKNHARFGVEFRLRQSPTLFLWLCSCRWSHGRGDPSKFQPVRNTKFAAKMSHEIMSIRYLFCRKCAVVCRTR